MSIARRTLALALCADLIPFASHYGWAQSSSSGRPPGDADAPEDPHGSIWTPAGTA